MSHSARVPHALHVCGGHTPYTRDEHARIRGIPILIVLVSPPSGRCEKRGVRGAGPTTGPPHCFYTSHTASPVPWHTPHTNMYPSLSACQPRPPQHSSPRSRTHSVTHAQARSRTPGRGEAVNTAVSTNPAPPHSSQSSRAGTGAFTYLRRITTNTPATEHEAENQDASNIHRP